MNLKAMTLIAAMLLPSMAVFAQSDSLRWIDRRGPALFKAAVPMAVAGLAVRPADRSFRRLWTNDAACLRNEVDNYTQYAPAALMLGLKAAGVEGRSSWGRMLTADAASVASMALLVNSIKYTVRRERPDGSSRNSFPSGHTATAFMCATMLHKEYGLTRSPWYSIAGYSVATATGVSRLINNRHWTSDVLVGAAIGVFSTELGYYVADLLFRERGIRHANRLTPMLDIADSRFWLGLEMGASFGLGGADGLLSTADGCMAGLSGGWRLSRHWGIAGRFDTHSYRLRSQEVLVPDGFEGGGNHIYSSSIACPGIELPTTAFTGEVLQAEGKAELLSLRIGPSYSLDLSRRFRLDAMATVGYASRTAWDEAMLSATRKLVSVAWGAGASLTCLAAENLGVRLFADYLGTPAPARRLTQQNTALSVGAAVGMLF